MDTLYVGNTHNLAVTGLRDDLGKALVSATVTATLYEADRATEVGGTLWPVVLLPVTDQPGDYAVTLPDDLEITAGGRYMLQVHAEFGGAVYTVNRTVLGRARSS